MLFPNFRFDPDSSIKLSLSKTERMFLLTMVQFNPGRSYKPASSPVVFLGKALNGTPPPLRGRQELRNLGNGNYQASVDVQSKIERCNSLSRKWKINMTNKKNITRADLKRIN